MKNKNYVGLRDVTIKFVLKTIEYLFPYYYGSDRMFDEKIKKEKDLDDIKFYLKDAMTILSQENINNDEIVDKFVSELDSVYEMLALDIKSGYEGDPAATSEDEVILCYPAFLAIGIYRIAHLFYMYGVKILPRIMSEYAHSKTGIDIHPGATIGKSFFIDHGTGVVIGETCVIENNVKLYQNVTLGARSFKKNADGSLVKGEKRHPHIGNNVVIYAGATILGGDTYIEDNSVIKGNAWII